MIKMVTRFDETKSKGTHLPSFSARSRGFHFLFLTNLQMPWRSGSFEHGCSVRIVPCANEHLHQSASPSDASERLAHASSFFSGATSTSFLSVFGAVVWVLARMDRICRDSVADDAATATRKKQSENKWPPMMLEERGGERIALQCEMLWLIALRRSCAAWGRSPYLVSVYVCVLLTSLPFFHHIMGF